MIYRRLRYGTILLCFIAHGHRLTDYDLLTIVRDAASEGHDAIINWAPFHFVTFYTPTIFRAASRYGHLNLIELFPTFNEPDILIECTESAIFHGHNKIAWNLIGRFPPTCVSYFELGQVAVAAENMEMVEFLWFQSPEHLLKYVRFEMIRCAKEYEHPKVLEFLDFWKLVYGLPSEPPSPRSLEGCEEDDL